MRNLKTKFKMTTALVGVSIMLGAMSLSGTALAQELKGFAKSYMKFTEEHLDKVEKMLSSGYKNNAASELKKAKYEFGKYESRNDADQQHPRAVSVRERMAKYEAAISGKSTAAAAPAPKAPAKPAGMELKGFAKSYLKFAEEEIARTEKNLQSGYPSNAMTSLDKAKYQMQKFEGTGPENQKHPRAIAAKEKIATYDAQIKAHFANANKPAAPATPKAAAAPTVKPATSSNTVAAAPKTPAASSGKSDKEWEDVIYLMGDNQDAIVKAAYFPKFANVKEISESFSGFDQAVSTAKTTLDGYEKAIAAGQKPSKPKLVLYAEDYAQGLRATLNSYGNRKDKFIQKSFKDATDAISSSNEAIARANGQDDKTRKIYEAGQASRWMREGFDQYDLIIKALGSSATADQQSQIKDINAARTDVEQNLAAIDSSIVAADQARIAANRFPDGFKASVADEVLAAAEKEFGTKILRSAEIEPWTERTEAKWINDSWVVGHYKYYKVWLAKKAETGKTFVYSMRFRQKQLSPGSWSDTRYYSVGTVFEVLPENLDK